MARLTRRVQQELQVHKKRQSHCQDSSDVAIEKVAQIKIDASEHVMEQYTLFVKGS